MMPIAAPAWHHAKRANRPAGQRFDVAKLDRPSFSQTERVLETDEQADGLLSRVIRIC